ncbi:hypothetical protein CsSME_00002618 [Camellia sinensis var. sinensis]
MHLLERAPYLPEKAPYSPEKRTAEANNKGPKALNILQETRYQAKCEAQIRVDQVTLLRHLAPRLNDTRGDSREPIVLGMNPQLFVYPSNHPGEG